MTNKKECSFIILLICILSLVGCKKSVQTMTNKQQLYFFDNTKSILVSESLPEDFYDLKEKQDKVKYIVGRLSANKTVQAATLQAGPEMPIQEARIKDKVVVIHFNQTYNDLSPQEKIGMRASLVYSLAELDFIDGVEFYVEEAPLTTATGNLVQTVYPSSINKEMLEPSPATTPYTLSVYFANQEGMLVKEEHSIRVSDPNALEKPLLEELIKGPNSDDLIATLPSDMKVKDASTVNGVCQIDLSFDAKSKFFENNKQKELMVYSIVNSLTSLPHIKKVVIFIDGKNDVNFTPDIDFTDTFERSESYISQEKLYS